MSSQQQQPQIPIQEGKELSEDEKQLISLFTDMEHKQLDFLDEAGKSLIERISTLLAILFAVTAFSNNFPPAYLKDNLFAKILVIVTLVFYLFALGSGILAIQPRSYKHFTHHIKKMREELEKITQYKMFWIRVAGVLFALGTIALAILIITIIWSV